jgi:hypothetical protein
LNSDFETLRSPFVRGAEDGINVDAVPFEVDANSWGVTVAGEIAFQGISITIEVHPEGHLRDEKLPANAATNAKSRDPKADGGDAHPSENGCLTGTEGFR